MPDYARQFIDMINALILGNTGQIGITVATRLREEGWNVTLAFRTNSGSQDFRHTQFDRSSPNAVQTSVGAGCDLLVDCIAFNASDDEALLNAQGSVGHIVAIFSASVCADAQGCTLDTAKTLGFPEYPVPIAQTHPTIRPGTDTYSPTRPHESKPYSKHAREWWFVKHMLDHRERIPLVDMGKNRFHTTSVQAIAEATLLATENQAPLILNVVDKDAPSVLEIGQTIARHLNSPCELVPIEPDHPTLGCTPCSTGSPIVRASTLPTKTTYADTIAPTLDWLKSIPSQNWKTEIPQLAAYPRDHFDYQTEDNITF